MSRSPLRRIGPAPRTGGSLPNRILGVVRLEIPTYEAIKRDPAALTQAVIVVALTALATNVWVAMFAPRGLISAVGGVVLALLAWLLFTGLVWWLGKQWFAPRNLPPDLGQILRLTGYATAPSLLNVLGFLPLIGWLVLMIASIWSLITAYTAVRVGLGASERNALGVTFIAYLANGLLFALAAGVLGIGRGLAPFP